MELNHYQSKALETSLYGTQAIGRCVLTLGLVGEAGEVAEKIKKWVRDKNAVHDKAFVEELKKELGDVLWYVSVLAHEFGISLEDIAQRNLQKIQDRVGRGVLQGEGDNR